MQTVVLVPPALSRRMETYQVFSLGLSPELSVWGFESPTFKKQKSTKKEKNHLKSYYPELTIVNFLVLFAMVVSFYSIYNFLNRILYCVC